MHHKFGISSFLSCFRILGSLLLPSSWIQKHRTTHFSPCHDGRMGSTRKSTKIYHIFETHNKINFKVEVLNLVPTIVNYMTKNKDQFENYNLSSVTSILCGSAPISSDQIKDFVGQYPHVKNFIQGLKVFLNVIFGKKTI